MDEREYVPNSNRYKNEQAALPASDKKKVEKVVKGDVKLKKKAEISKAFIAEDIRNVGSYIVMDVLIPAAKKALSDIVANGIDMLLYGETGRRNKRSTTSDYVSYRNYSDRDRDRDRKYEGSRSVLTYRDVTIDSRAEAHEVLERMNEIIEEYTQVSIADLNEMLGITGHYTDNNYGWYSLRTASVEMARGGGWELRLPKAQPLK